MKFTNQKLMDSMVKKVPVLNTSKHAERMRVLQEELKDSTPANNGTVSAPVSTSSSPDQKSKMTLGTMKFKIIILSCCSSWVYTDTIYVKYHCKWR